MMLLYHSVITYKINNMEQYILLRDLLEVQLENLCSEKNNFLPKCAFWEALSNSVYHGDFPINIEFNNLTSNELLITITDSGNGFLVHEKIKLINQKGADKLLEEKLYSDGGRGICIMFKAIKKVRYNDKGNEVSLVISNP